MLQIFVDSFTNLSRPIMANVKMSEHNRSEEGKKKKFKSQSVFVEMIYDP